MNKKDQKEYQKLKLGEISKKGPAEEIGNLMDDDLLDSKKAKQKQQKEREIEAEQQKKLREQNRREQAEKRKKKRQAALYPVKKFFKDIFSTVTYVSIIQRFEELLLVLFIDALMLFTLVSLSYIIYMMFAAKSTDSLPTLIFKVATGVVVCTICLIAQANIPEVNKSNSVNQEDEE